MSLSFARVVADLARSNDVARAAQARREDGFQAPGHRRQGDLPFVRWTLALQQMDMKVPVKTEAELDAQRRRRGFVLRRCWAAQEDGPLARLCTDLQAPNLLLPGLGQPRNQQPSRIGLDQLLGNPQALRRGFGLNPDEMALVEAGVFQTRQVGRLRRSDHDDVATVCHDLAHGRCKQAPLRDSRLRLQDLGQ
jgi:hypothetical protein